MVAQLTFNQRVVGSTPTVSTRCVFVRVGELKRTVNPLSMTE